MKKLFVFCLATMFISAVSFSQEVSEIDKKECQPTKECAAKMGMTLEQCKAICQKSSSRSRVAQSDESISADIILASATTESQTGAKSCCSIAQCAKELGISVEECLKRCAPKNGERKTAVAGVVMESNDGKKPCCSKAIIQCAKKE